jgi:hypothetical protein
LHPGSTAKGHADAAGHVLEDVGAAVIVDIGVGQVSMDCQPPPESFE